MSDNVSARSGRLVHLDVLRLIAIYFVIFNHTGNRGYMLFAERMDSALYFTYMMASVLCKVAVPIFFMISGALLLPRQESLRKLYSKRILRMAVVLVLISVPYYIWLHRDQGLSLTSFLSYIYGNNASTSLWYLYSYIALLMMLPFLRSMVKNMGEKEFRYLIAGYLIMVGIVPCVECCLWEGDKTLNSSFGPVLFLTQNTFYALVGYYVEHVAGIQKYGKKLIFPAVLLNLISFAVTGVMTHHLMLSGERDTAQLEQFFSCFICIPAVSLYVLVKSINWEHISERVQKFLSMLGGAVFGVYLIEKFGRALTDSVYTLTAPMIGSFAASLIWCFAVLVLSLTIVILLKRIPVVGKIIGRFL